MNLTPPSLYSSTLWSNRTVGLLGGSFNPAHEGHLHVSLVAMARLGLDAVWWMVSPQNPLKSARGMAPLEKRMASAEKSAKHPGIFVTDIETKLKTRYTADTLEKLATLYPATRFVWLMGMDNLHQIHRWDRWEDIFKSVAVCVIDRPLPGGSRMAGCIAAERFADFRVDERAAALLKTRKLPAWTVLHAPLNGQSSTKIREKGRKA